MKKMLLVIAMMFVSLQAREVIEAQGTCKINWTGGFITCEGESAEGQSSYAAKLSAKVIAQRNLLEVIRGVQIDSAMTIKDGMFSSDVIHSRVSGVVKGAQLISNKYDKKEKYAVATLKLQMGKDLLSALLSDPKLLSWNEKIEKAWNSFSIVANANAATYSPSEKATIQKVLEDLRKRNDEKGTEYLTSVLNEMEDSVYSGILIDVSEIDNFKKAMIVKLVDESGKEVYPAKIVSKKTLLKRNTSVGYIYGLKDARESKRVKSKPIEIKAKAVYKKRYSNIVLTKEQLAVIESLAPAILQKAKVILVMGE